MTSVTFTRLVLVAALLAFAAPALAQEVPPFLSSQGRVFNAADNQPITGTRALTFALYDSQDPAAAPLWAETQTVLLSDGFYSVILGQVEAMDLDAFTGAQLYLGVAIDSDPELSPRMAVNSVPYAIKARSSENATGALTPESVTIGDVVIDASGVTVGGNNVIDGSGQWTGSAPTIQYGDLQGLPTTLSDLPCAEGEVAKRVGGAWACAEDIDTDTDTDTTYDAGDGVALTGTTFSVDGSVQRRTAAGAFTCPPGEYLRAVAADGTPTCAPDADTNTTYSAGDGLAFSGSAFSVDGSVQRRTAADALTCPPGEYLQAVAADGTPTCAPDANTAYAVAANSGLTLSGATFGTDVTVQRRNTSPACPAGQYLQVIAANGAPTCVADANTTYTAAAGGGLTLSGTAFSVNTAAVQARIGGACPPGSAIRAIDAAGAVTCDTPAPYAAAAGSGLTLSGTTFGTDTGVLQGRVNGACAAGESIRVINQNGTVTCEADDNTTYSATANGGLTLGAANDFFIAPNGVTSARIADNAVTSAKVADGTLVFGDTNVDSIQRRVTGVCPAGQYMRGINNDGTVACAAPALSCRTVTSATTGNAITVTCPAGTLVTGGGIREDLRGASGNNLSMLEDSRPEGNGWFCDTGYGAGVSLCYAICCAVQ